MKKTGTATLPLHAGKAPTWLFKRMVTLGREILLILRIEYNSEEILRKLSDPFWFQALGCVMGFDWHSSGITTTVCGALKEALKDIGSEVDMYVAGGKGKIAISTPLELKIFGEKTGIDADSLIYASKISAKVDNTALQDGYSLYHHSIFFTRTGKWCVIQQGMNPIGKYARRYHWLGENIGSYVCEPHSAICTVKRKNQVLNLIARESKPVRASCVELTKEHPNKILKETKKILTLSMPSRHYIKEEDINWTKLKNTLIKLHESPPDDFESLLGTRGVGEKTLRALTLISEIIYGSTPSFRDPARFSFAHGGKDGHPYPLNTDLYDRSINILREAVTKAKIGYSDKLKVLRRLSQFENVSTPS